MRTWNIFFTSTVTLMVLTAMSLVCLAQDKTPSRFPVDFQSYYQEYPVPEFNAQNSVILLESDFEGYNNWDGWTRKDMTGSIDSFWQVSTYNAGNLGGSGNHAWWCGKTFPADCGTGDFNGYGNYWDTNLIWTHDFSSPDQPHTVTVRADLNLDTETGFDFLSLNYLGDSGWVPVATFTGPLVNEQIDISFSTEPYEIYGSLILVWHFESDGATSDEDCGRPSLGAAQIDNIEVLRDGVQFGFEDNEGPGNEWSEYFENCGNFSELWSGLEDIDVSASNYSVQVAFYDDQFGGGTYCINWCYGRNGMIVNNTGGYCGPDKSINSEIWSPIVSFDGVPYDPVDVHLSFDAYRHEPLDMDSPGIFYYWRVRGLDSGNQPLGAWEQGPYFYGEPKYVRHYHDLTAYIEPGYEKIQVALGIIDLGDVWGWEGHDGTPAPYFDNISLIASQSAGLILEAKESDLAQDNFPTQGGINYSDLGSNHIRVDAARNIAAPEEMINTPQDAVICRAVSLGSQISGPPELFYTVGPNPLFDPYRLPMTGSVTGVPVVGSENEFAFLLPDEGLIFPGDVMHYYISAVNDDGITAHIPADTSGYNLFPGASDYIPLQYPSKYTMRGLPSLKSATMGDQPKILFWNDFGGRGEEAKWIYALENLGFNLGQEYDLYYTNHPSSGLGNGLGGRANFVTLEGYDTILYSCGDLGVFTLSNGDFVTDAGNDLDVLDEWIQSGDKDLLLTGSNLYYDLLNNVGTVGEAFASNWLGIDLTHQSVRNLINGQGMPGVMAVTGNAVFDVFTEWAVGPGPTGNPLTWINAIETTGGANRCAEFTDPGGNPGAYPYAAATNFERPDYLYKNVCLPYDLMDIAYPPAKTAEPTAARTKVLEEILYYFGYSRDPVDEILIPDVLLCSASRKFPGIPISVFTVPNGMGKPLTNCNLYPDSPSELEWVDETITLVVKDWRGVPIPNYPTEDMWLATSEGGLIICRPGGTAADNPTDSNGRTTFSGPFFGGGYTDPNGSERLQVIVNRDTVPDADFRIYFNSSDINGDCRVNLSDVSLFTQDYYSDYNYRSDFAADHVLNLTDVSFLARSYGASGAKKTGEIEDNETKYSFDGQLGLYADPEGSRNYLEVAPDTAFNLYLMMNGSVSEEGLRGWECRVEVPHNVDIQEWRLTGQALNLMEAPEFIVGMAEALPAGGSTLLAVAQCVARDESPALFRLLPASVSSVNPALPTIAVGDNETIARLASIQVAAEEPEGPVFGVNVGSGLSGYRGDPSRFALHPNSPNPFNPQTEIRFDVPSDGQVDLAIYGLDGRRVATLVSEIRTRGSYVVIWNGLDGQGQAVASGVYLYRMEAGAFVQTRRMVLLK